MIQQFKTSHFIYGLIFLFLLSLPLYAESDFVVAIMPDGLSGSALLHVGILIFMFAYLSSSWNILVFLANFPLALLLFWYWCLHLLFDLCHTGVALDWDACRSTLLPW